ncbi:MAG: hypothetical protein IT318_25985 [Anaerolineales bacterium]|nr:hypothetical protein [Anaerolineales bacterium]
MRQGYPKKARIVILADALGRTKFLSASQYRLRCLEERRQGFAPVAALSIPLRRLAPPDGCCRYYRCYVRRLSDLRKEPLMNLMQTAVLEILRRHHLDKSFNTATEFHLRIENPPFMPLVIERQGNVISVAHYGELNGDAIRDPELTFTWPTFEPLSITQDPVGRYAEIHTMVGDRPAIHMALMRELRMFANLWARNLMAQGFGQAGVTVSSLTHPLPSSGSQ